MSVNLLCDQLKTLKLFGMHHALMTQGYNPKLTPEPNQAEFDVAKRRRG